MNAAFLSDTQLSVIAQTLVFWDKMTDSSVSDVVISGHGMIIETLQEILRDQKSFSDPILQVAFGSTSHDKYSGDFLASISEFKSALATCKESYVHLLGPDIFEILRKALEPEFVLSPLVLEQSRAVAKKWDIGALFQQCLELRKSRNHPNDRSLMLSDLLQDASLPVFSGSIQKLKAIQASCDDIDSRALTECVLEAYNFDAEVVAWIDWDTVYECVAISERSISLKDAALHLLMGQRQVQECFPLIALAEGDGAFASSLRATVRERRIKDLRSLTETVGELSGRSRDLVAGAILQHDNSLELTGLIGYDPPWAKRLIQAKALSFDARATAFRHDAADAFLGANIITNDLALEIKADAITSLRVAYLRGRQQNGLVHLRLAKITQDVELLLSEPTTLVRSIISTSNLVDTRTYKAKVITTLSKMVADHVLLLGPDALKTTMSDSLRHGQLRNRFMQAFDEALMSTSLSVTDTHPFYTEIASPSHPQHWMLLVRQKLRDAIRDFNERHLSVDEKSVLYASILQVTASFLESVLFTPEERSIDVWQSDVERACTEFLSSAQKEFAKDFAKLSEGLRLERDEAFVRSLQSQNRRINATAFYEALVQNVSVATQECSGWIAIARDENLDISFQDLVQLCLVTHSPGSSGKFQVKAVVSEYRREGVVQLRKERLLAASLFEPLETICKNLISNCFEHSGLGRNVNIDLELTLGKNRITIHARNTISVARHRALSQKLGEMQVTANAPSLRRAGEDKSSGLAKIAWACNRFFGSMPNFKISLGRSPFTFNVRVDVRTKNAISGR
ncbi:hypothetical protein LB577_27450 [Mesorhizobium sp. B283B1A]|uniref:hypothetical protein n=1 Tax=Mesorhizobium TaxID=68287 RepID=UPI001CD1945A|nr:MULTISPECIES: hypothetical protein [Mesorhizobium]MCA0050644.1 hypothetical protein [Mesorhizobium sp. B283B1A]UQS66924.1 hypothetical protein M5D98_11605 [Mesorhizobium opportunistum]